MAITNTIPDSLGTNVLRNIFIEVTFDVALDRSTITDYTVIVVKTSTQEIVSGKVDYIPGTNTITFWLFDMLAANTEYTVILVGGESGIKELTPNVAFSSSNFIFSFTTGESIDWNIPLATTLTYEDGPYFRGENGVYQEVFGRTGEPISHIVTTAATVGPSGTIVPAPFGPDRYLPPSGTTPEGEIFALVSSDPVDDETNVLATDPITFTFNGDLASVGSVAITVDNILGFDLPLDNDIANYSFQIDGDDYIITPSGSLTEMAPSADYMVTLSNIVDVGANTISSVVINFRTKIVPFYSTVKLIRSNLGALIASDPDSDIEDLIYENSLWAFNNASGTQEFLIGSPSQAANDYVTCKTKLDMLERRYLIGGQVTKKSLADLTVEYGSGLAKLVMNKVDKLEKCIEKNELILTTGTGHITAVSAVKAYFDPRYPHYDSYHNINSTWNRLPSKDFEE